MKHWFKFGIDHFRYKEITIDLEWSIHNLLFRSFNIYADGVSYHTVDYQQSWSLYQQS